MTPARRHALLAVVLLGLAVVAYAPSLGGTFVYDDHRFVANNTAIRSPSRVVAFFTDPSTVDPEGNWEGIYRPLRSFTYSLDYLLFGTNPVGYRIHNLLIHVAAALALAMLLGRLLRHRGAGALLGCLYVVHPVHVESVAWITSRADVQSGLLALLTLLAMRGRGGLRVGLGVLLFVLAVFTKESAVVVPLIGLLLERLVPLRSRPPGVASLARWAPMLVLVPVYLLVRGAVLGDHGVQRPFWGDSWFVTAASMAVGAGWYVWRLILPIGFRFDYQLPLETAPWAVVMLCVVAVLVGGAVAVVVWRARERCGGVAGGLAWSVLALAPVSNIVVPINILVAERFLYLPAAGWLLAVGAVGVTVARARPGLVRPLVFVSLAWLAVFGWITTGFAAKWAGERSLWSAVVENQPRHFRGHFGLARVHRVHGDYEAARRLLRHTIGLTGPRYADVYFDLGRTYLLENRQQEALPHLRRAVDLWRAEGTTDKNRRYVACLEQLRNAYTVLGDRREAGRMDLWLREATSGTWGPSR